MSLICLREVGGGGGGKQKEQDGIDLFCKIHYFKAFLKILI